MSSKPHDNDDGEEEAWLPELNDHETKLLLRARKKIRRLPGYSAMRFQKTVLLTFGLLVVLSIILLATLMEEWGLIHQLGCVLGWGGWIYHTSPNGHCNIVRMDVPLGGSFECLPLMIKPSATICIHDVPIDTFISGTIKGGELWEGHIVKALISLLDEDPDIGLVDIGANIGQFSLIAAARGHPVVAVDAHIKHVKMLQRSALINRFTNNFTIVYNAVSDAHRIMALQFSRDNQGATRVIDDETSSSGGFKHYRPAAECMPKPAAGHVESILIDDLLEVITFKQAIIKIDIEGHESRSIPYAEQLLKDIRVPAILMEWVFISRSMNDFVRKDAFELINFLSGYSYEPYSLNDIKLNKSLWNTSWPENIMWKLIESPV